MPRSLAQGSLSNWSRGISFQPDFSDGSFAYLLAHFMQSSSSVIVEQMDSRNEVILPSHRLMNLRLNTLSMDSKQHRRGKRKHLIEVAYFVATVSHG